MTAIAVVASVLVVGAINVPSALAGYGTFPTEPAGSPFAAGTDPFSVAVGDFDNDGDEDLATANYGSDNISVRLGAGDGTFPAEPAGSPFPLGLLTAPQSVAVGDFDNDGDEDLATANFDSSNISVRLGAGDGTFTTEPAGSPFAAGNAPTFVAVGDVNNDGDDDLATANSGGNVTVRLGAGDGTFAIEPPGSPFAAGGLPLAVAMGDFDNDGDEDLAAVNANSDDITVRLGAGDGTFATQAAGSPFAAGDNPRALAVGDFDTDGNEDLATANVGTDDITVRLGAGNGSFPGQAAGSPFATEDAPRAVAVGDFNSDGNEDLATANDGADITIRLGAGDGSFATQAMGSPFVAAGSPRALAVGDFNSDGNEDLATANYTGNNVTVRLGAGPPADAGNLLTSGGGEGAGAARNSSDSPAVSGWGDTSAFTHVRYGTFGGFPERLISNRIIGQEAFFAGGPAAANTATSQTVDVSASAVSIDAGLASATLSGYLGGFRTSDDRMQATAVFKDAGGETLTTAQIGPVTASDRKNKTTLLRRATSIPVPAGTRSIEVTLTAIRVGGAYNDAYADRIGLFLDAPAPPVPDPDPEPDPTPDQTPDLTPADTTITLDVSAKKSQRAAKLTLSAGCGAEPCQLAVSGKLKVKQRPQKRARNAAGFKLKPANVALAADASQKVRITLKGKGALSELIELLRKGGKATAKLKVTGTDGAGNTATRSVLVKLKP